MLGGAHLNPKKNYFCKVQKIKEPWDLGFNHLGFLQIGKKCCKCITKNLSKSSINGFSMLKLDENPFYFAQN